MIDIQIKNKVSFRFICRFRNISSQIRILTIEHDTLPFKYDKISLSNVDEDIDKNNLYKDKNDLYEDRNNLYEDRNNLYKDKNNLYIGIINDIYDNKNYLLSLSYNNKLIIISDSIPGHNIKYSDSIEIPLYYYEDKFNKEYKDEYEIPEEVSTSSGLTERFKKIIMFIMVLLGISLIGLCIIL